MDLFNAAVDTYVAAGVDGRSALEIECAAKIGPSGGPLLYRCATCGAPMAEARGRISWCPGCKVRGAGGGCGWVLGFWISGAGAAAGLGLEHLPRVFGKGARLLDGHLCWDHVRF